MQFGVLLREHPKQKWGTGCLWFGNWGGAEEESPTLAPRDPLTFQEHSSKGQC